MLQKVNDFSRIHRLHLYIQLYWNQYLTGSIQCDTNTEEKKKNHSKDWNLKNSAEGSGGHVKVLNPCWVGSLQMENGM